jgi:CelD/BcsL family acetyltransferase involved in cellulose biosynthesis
MPHGLAVLDQRHHEFSAALPQLGARRSVLARVGRARGNRRLTRAQRNLGEIGTAAADIAAETRRLLDASPAHPWGGLCNR